MVFVGKTTYYKKCSYEKLQNYYQKNVVTTNYNKKMLLPRNICSYNKTSFVIFDDTENMFFAMMIFVYHVLHMSEESRIKSMYRKSNIWHFI